MCRVYRGRENPQVPSELCVLELLDRGQAESSDSDQTVQLLL